MTVSVVAGKPSVSTGEQAIQWAPMSGPERLAFNGTDYEAVRRTLIGVFGQFPIRLSRGKHLEIMQAMAHAAGEGFKPYSTLADALDRFGELEVTCV